MGLANLVPGISGGTMLLAAGVYPAFIAGIAELTTLRFRVRTLVLIGSIVAAAALAILMLAGTIRGLVIDHRYVMYSLFIGLTLGGIPLIWRMVRPSSPATWVGSAADQRSYLLILLSGVAASSAMILPGVSGGYLLLVLGQYENILGTIDQLKRGLLGDDATGAGPDLALLFDALHVVVPLGLGIVVGVVGVSNLLRWLLDRYEKATLGALLGLLLGAVVGLWPFQQPEPPVPGDVVKGQVVTEANLAGIEPEDWALARFDPSGGQVGVAAGCIAAGLFATLLIGRIGRDENDGA
jgi:putative membrane protein